MQHQLHSEGGNLTYRSAYSTFKDEVYRTCPSFICQIRSAHQLTEGVEDGADSQIYLDNMKSNMDRFVSHVTIQATIVSSSIFVQAFCPF